MTYPQAAPKPSNGLATAAMVLGIIATAGAFIPVLNIGSVVLAILAFIFALIGLTRARRNGGYGVAPSIAGLILAVATVIITPLVNVATINAVDEIMPTSATEALADVGKDSEEPTENTVDSEATVAQHQALRHAESYLDTMPFSKTGLIHQLVEFEGYEEADADYAVDHLGADWNEQAALSAKNYLDTMAFSRDGLIHQLVEFEGFTSKQAEHGVNEAGL